MWPLACALLMLLAVCGPVQADSDKRAEMSPMPFVLGSRYGRSLPRMLTPRNDRFFMGSRYGKRSEPPLPPHTSRIPAVDQDGSLLVCQYIGFGSLYKCTPGQEETTRHGQFDIGKAEEETVVAVED